MDALGIGLIGCGNISAAYLRLAPLFRGLKLVAVADIDMTAASARASTSRCPRPTRGARC